MIQSFETLKFEGAMQHTSLAFAIAITQRLSAIYVSHACSASCDASRDFPDVMHLQRASVVIVMQQLQLQIKSPLDKRFEGRTVCNMVGKLRAVYGELTV